MASGSDNFNRTNSTGLGANFAFGTGNFNIVSNAARCAAAIETPALAAYTATAPDTANQRSTLTILQASASAYIGPAVRASNTQNTCYGFTASTTESALFRYVNGTYTQLGSVGPGFASGTRLRIEVEGTGATVTLRVYADTGGGFAPVTAIAVGGTINDTSGSRIVTPNYCGFAGYGAASANADLDDWSFEDLASSGVTGTMAATEGGSDTLAASGGVGSLGLRMTLRDTDTGALVANKTGLIVSVRKNSNDTAVLYGATGSATDVSGVLEFSSNAIGEIGDYIYVTVDTADNSIVATYRTQVIDLNA